MNLDRTFCTGLECSQAKTCERWTTNLRNWAIRTGFDLEGKHISVTQFVDRDGECHWYTPMESKDDQRE